MRVGLTGGIGSGKSTVAAILAEHGAHVLASDDIARGLMVPGTDVSKAIAAKFGPGVVLPDGTLDRAELARLAFAGGRVEELNAIVHPATIALQTEMAAALEREHPGAIVVTESALIFESKYGGNWRQRFDKLILVCAPDDFKIKRFIARAGPSGDAKALEAEARRRLAQMIPDGDKVHRVNYVIRNDWTVDSLRGQVDRVWASLVGEPTFSLDR